MLAEIRAFNVVDKKLQEAQNRLTGFAKAKNRLVRWDVPGKGYEGEYMDDELTILLLTHLQRVVTKLEEEQAIALANVKKAALSET